jgi:serine/threonine protein kinase
LSSSIPARIGRYEIVDRLGAGGMGVVYLATDPMLRRTVAVKVLPSSDDAGARARFLREARAVAALRHPNIVTIFDLGEDQGRLFIAMERIEGQSMADAISQGTAYSLERKLQLILDLCAGLGFAHQHGVIHRDIKPGNLMITTDGSLKVLDFGLARLVAEGADTALTQSGAVIGTLNYMAPEQVSGDPVDRRADIFSTGLVLYEWLSSQRAFSGDSIHRILHDIVYKNPTPLRTVMPSIDPALAAIVEKALEKDPARRYQSLDEMAVDVRRALDRHPGVAEDATVIVGEPATSAGDAAVTILSPSPTRDVVGVITVAATVLVVAVISVYLLMNRPEAPVSIPVTESATQPATNTTSSVQAPPPVKMPEVPSPQRVSVDVMPWARVRIVAVGHDAAVPSAPLETPFTVELAPGDYRLECENDGVSPRTVFPITVTAGRSLTVNRTMRGFNAADVVDSLAGPRRP